MVQRVYGVTFPDKKLMEEYKRRIEEAKKRDHRRLGTQQKLFFFDAVSPGSAFFLPRGMTICRRLTQVLPVSRLLLPVGRVAKQLWGLHHSLLA